MMDGLSSIIFTVTAAHEQQNVRRSLEKLLSMTTGRTGSIAELGHLTRYITHVNCCLVTPTDSTQIDLILDIIQKITAGKHGTIEELSAILGVSGDLYPITILSTIEGKINSEQRTLRDLIEIINAPIEEQEAQ